MSSFGFNIVPARMNAAFLCRVMPVYHPIRRAQIGCPTWWFWFDDSNVTPPTEPPKPDLAWHGDGEQIINVHRWEQEQIKKRPAKPMTLLYFLSITWPSMPISLCSHFVAGAVVLSSLLKSSICITYCMHLHGRKNFSLEKTSLFLLSSRCFYSRQTCIRSAFCRHFSVFAFRNLLFGHSCHSSCWKRHFCVGARRVCLFAETDMNVAAAAAAAAAKLSTIGLLIHNSLLCLSRTEENTCACVS